VQSLTCLPIISLGSTPDKGVYGNFTIGSVHTCYVFQDDPTVVSASYESSLSLVPLVVIVPGACLALLAMPIYCIYRSFHFRKASLDSVAPALAY